MKTKIKILVMTVALTLFMTSKATAQGMPVYDNTNFISLVKSLVESAKQTSQLIKSVKFLKDAKEAIEKVSSVVQQLNAVQEIADNNQRLINVMQTDLQDILSFPVACLERRFLMSSSNSILNSRRSSVVIIFAGIIERF